MNELWILNPWIHIENNLIHHFSYRENDASETSDDARDGHYEPYRDSKLPEGYTPYRQNTGVSESEYDRYEYDHGESPNGQRPKKTLCEKLRSCCSDMGRLTKSVLSHKKYRTAISNRLKYHHQLLRSPLVQAMEKDHQWPQATSIVNM